MTMDSYYDSYALSYDWQVAMSGYAFCLQRFVTRIGKGLCPQPRMILELGCGTGLATQVLCRLFPQAEILAVDLSPPMLKILQSKNLPVRLIRGNFHEPASFREFTSGQPVTIAPGTMSLVFSSGALSEYSDLDILLPWIWQLLENNGRLINIGVRNHWLGKWIGKVQKFSPPGEAIFIGKLQRHSFTQVETYSFRPTEVVAGLVKYCVAACK